MTRRWTWLLESVVLAIHDMQLAEHGGSQGIRDRGLLQSALARPRNVAAYAAPDASALAACYAWGLAHDHPFIDGNKRVAFVAMEVFLGLNGWELTADDAACLEAMLAVAAGSWSEEVLGDWLRTHVRRSRA